MLAQKKCAVKLEHTRNNSIPQVHAGVKGEKTKQCKKVAGVTSAGMVLHERHHCPRHHYLF